MARRRFRRLLITACAALSIVPTCDEELAAASYVDFGTGIALARYESVAPSEPSILYAQPSCE